MANLPISSSAFYVAYQKYYADGEPNNNIRLGQYLCNTFNITDNAIYYETNAAKAMELFVDGYVK